MHRNHLLRKIIRILRDDINPATERGRLVRATLGGTALKATSAALSLLASLFYARTLGPHGYGIYAYVLALVSIISIITSSGLPGYIVREGARGTAPLSVLQRYTDLRIAAGGVAAACIISIIAFGFSAEEKKWLFVIGAVIPLITNMSAARQSLLQVYGWIARSQIPSLIIAPLVTLITAVALWIGLDSLSPLNLMIATLTGSILALSLGQYQWRRAHQAAPPTAHDTTGLSVLKALPFMWLSGMYLVMSRTDLLMLGTLSTSYDAGLYAVSSRSAELLVFVGMAAVTATAPQMARLHKQGNNTQLQRLLAGMSVRLLITTLPAALLMIIFAGPILAFFYGEDYRAGEHSLRILTIAQLLSVLGGPLGTLLNMSGNEKLHMRAIGIGVLTNIALNITLIPKMGIEGAALATCTSIILSRAMLIIGVRKKLKLKTTAFGI